MTNGPFGTRKAVLDSRLRAVSSVPELNLENLERKNDKIHRSQPSAQNLGVYRSIYHEALSVLYTNTTFYLHGGAHFASLPRLVDRNSVRKIALRMDVEEGSKYVEFGTAMQPLCLVEGEFPIKSRVTPDQDRSCQAQLQGANLRH